MTWLGWLGSICFSVCGVPQAIECHIAGHGKGLSHAFIWLWAVGEILTLIYVLSLTVSLAPLIFNYGFNLGTLIIIIRYKYWPRRRK
jgi:hypothetical protein